jgi:hypothetical protein
MLKPWLTGDYLVRSTICGIPYGQRVILRELPGTRFLRQEMCSGAPRDNPGQEACETSARMSTLDRLWLFRMQEGTKAGRHVVVWFL